MAADTVVLMAIDHIDSGVVIVTAPGVHSRRDGLVDGDFEVQRGRRRSSAGSDVRVYARHLRTVVAEGGRHALDHTRAAGRSPGCSFGEDVADMNLTWLTV